MLFSLLKHYLELYITDNALKVSPSLYCFTTFISHGVEIISPGCGVQASLMLFFLHIMLQHNLSINVRNKMTQFSCHKVKYYIRVFPTFN